MADKPSDDPENRGLSALIKRTIHSKFSHEAAFGFVEGATWGNGHLIHLPLGASMLGGFIALAGGLFIDGRSYDNFDTQYPDTTLQQGFSSPLGYYAIDTTDDDKNNPHILVKEGDNYRLYSSQLVQGGGSEWTSIDNQTEAWRHASQTLENLLAVRVSLNQAGTDTPDFYPSIKHFDKISGLYADHYSGRDQIQRRSSTPQDGLEANSAPIAMDAELDRAISHWKAAIEAIRAGDYGYSTATQYSVIGETPDDKTVETALISQTSDKDRPLTTHPDALPEQHRHTFSNAAIPVATFTLKALAFSSLGLGLLGGIGNAGVGVYNRRRARKKKTPTQRK